MDYNWMNARIIKKKVENYNRIEDRLVIVGFDIYGLPIRKDKYKVESFDDTSIKAKMVYGNNISIDEIEDAPFGIYTIKQVKAGICNDFCNFMVKEIELDNIKPVIDHFYITDIVKTDNIHTIILHGRKKEYNPFSNCYVAKGYVLVKRKLHPVTDWYIKEGMCEELIRTYNVFGEYNNYGLACVSTMSDYVLAKRIEEDYNRKINKMAA